MSPAIQGTLVGFGCSTILAIIGIWATWKLALKQLTTVSADIRAQIAAASADVRAQIEADRLSRIWEGQATAYVDAIRAIHHRQDVRRVIWEGVVTGTEPPRPPASYDWSEIEARLVIYATLPVIAAFRAATQAARDFEQEVALYRNTSGARLAERDNVQGKLDAAGTLDNELTELLRRDVHAGRMTVEARAEAVTPSPPTQP